jgi:prepilin-type N-terminal cleavage/methylation domain-containing protein
MQKAFTMLELVFVIAVTGIIAMMIIPRMDRDNIYEMGEQVLSHIKYTQHLAMTDNVYDHTRNDWYKARWHIDFVNGSCGVFYRVGSDQDLSSGTGDFTQQESARDPLTKSLIYNNTSPCDYRDGWYEGVLLGQKYNVVSMTSSCNTQRIVFDHIGRPYTGFHMTSPQMTVMNNDCNYTFTDGNSNSITITVTAETGYSYITYN